MIRRRTLLYGALALYLAGCDRTQPREPDSSTGSASSEGTGAVGGSPSAAAGEPELLYDLTALGRPVAIHYHDRQLYFGVMTNAAYEFYQAPADGSGTPRKLGESTAGDAGIMYQVLARLGGNIFWTADSTLVRHLLPDGPTEEFATGMPLALPGGRVVKVSSSQIATAQRDCAWLSVFASDDMSRIDFSISVAESQVPGGVLTIFQNKIYCPTDLRVVSYSLEKGTEGQVEVYVPQREEGYKFGDLAVFNDQLYTVRSALRENAIVERLDNGALAHVATLDGAYQSVMVADEQRGVFFLADITGWEHPIYKVDVATGTVTELVGTAQPAKYVEADEKYLYWTTDNYVVPKEHLRSGIYRQSKDAPTR